MISLRQILVAVATTFAFTACGSDPVDPNSAGAPPVPLAESMLSSADFFSQASAGDAVATDAGAHFLAAAIATTVVRASVVAATAVPAIAIAASAPYEATFEERAWHWRYPLTGNDVTYDAHLIGTYTVGSGSTWEMRVSSDDSEPPLDDFLWFTGKQDRFQSTGEWQLFDPTVPSASGAVLRINWYFTNNWRVVFTNLRPGGEQGDWLEYESTGALRRIQYFDKSANTFTVIQWNESTKEGYYQAPGYNGGAKACWNSLLVNVTCTV